MQSAEDDLVRGDLDHRIDAFEPLQGEGGQCLAVVCADDVGSGVGDALTRGIQLPGCRLEDRLGAGRQDDPSSIAESEACHLASQPGAHTGYHQGSIFQDHTRNSLHE